MYLQPQTLNNGAQYYASRDLPPYRQRDLSPYGPRDMAPMSAYSHRDVASMSPSRHSVNLSSLPTPRRATVTRPRPTVRHSVIPTAPPPPCHQCRVEAERRSATGTRSLKQRFLTWKTRRKDTRRSQNHLDSPNNLQDTSTDNTHRYDSLRQIDRSDAPIEEDLKNAPWYQAGIPREIALEMLSQEDIGSFVVRDSTTHPGCYALSVKVPKFDNPSGISHYLIMRSPHGGVRLKGLDKSWSSLTSLVTHHSVMKELLPCPLRLPRTANNPAFSDDDKATEVGEEDEDYQRLADFSRMMQDLKM